MAEGHRVRRPWRTRSRHSRGVEEDGDRPIVTVSPRSVSGFGHLGFEFLLSGGKTLFCRAGVRGAAGRLAGTAAGRRPGGVAPQSRCRDSECLCPTLSERPGGAHPLSDQVGRTVAASGSSAGRAHRPGEEVSVSPAVDVAAMACAAVGDLRGVRDAAGDSRVNDLNGGRAGRDGDLAGCVPVTSTAAAGWGVRGASSWPRAPRGVVRSSRFSSVVSRSMRSSAMPGRGARWCGRLTGRRAAQRGGHQPGKSAWAISAHVGHEQGRARSGGFCVHATVGARWGQKHVRGDGAAGHWSVWDSPDSRFMPRSGTAQGKAGLLHRPGRPPECDKDSYQVTGRV
ncbi:hypothetical protein Tbis_1817 [Thermobispora bispora DSM 43833]|uniref:Uncharacterized protein n=1 Tax=Thermobispora bispora (strain ATCC 19993 / DSM 43833 / CBS 139.67 / JCM 10125 / KCTC 9307 / NBRC 14880 / R51) TaxID=469371 RepID=D6YBG9_THEBD|nr:hypothetical protein Tbis_1817 [Thermobispora bispora DSM 43833]